MLRNRYLNGFDFNLDSWEKLSQHKIKDRRRKV